jgi:hypothetical protein
MGRFTVDTTELEDKKLAWLAKDSYTIEQVVQAIVTQKLQDHDADYINSVGKYTLEVIEKLSEEDKIVFDEMIAKVEATEAAKKEEEKVIEEGIIPESIKEE